MAGTLPKRHKHLFQVLGPVMIERSVDICRRGSGRPRQSRQDPCWLGLFRHKPGGLFHLPRVHLADQPYEVQNRTGLLSSLTGTFK